ncbi:MAG: bifunctional metallophosphatase/5'-nucleotidase [Bacteroidales bacterium]|nr:bifunctional metallophosphatase/5'-nucleotidase [Bacteroidales bacterium]
MKRVLISILAAVAVVASCCGPKDGEYTLRILTTNDVHGHYFDSLYTTADRTAPSMMSVAWHVDSIRVAEGAENVILLDAGDCLHGDNASYYFNYVDTESKHVFVRMLEYLDYVAWIPGNHDFEVGHPVYDRIAETLDVPILATNAVHADSGKPYFEEFVTVKRHGLKITIIGFTNPNIKNAYAPELWSGLDFISTMPDFAQNAVDRISAQEKSDVVIVAIHSGAGKGDGSQIDQQGLDLFKSLKGVDLLVCAHDHRALVLNEENISMVNTGNYCANLGSGTITVTVENGKVVDKKVNAELIPLDKNKTDEKMKAHFHSDYEAVKAYTTRYVGDVEMNLNGFDVIGGMSDYMNLLHTVCLGASDAKVSLMAPTSLNMSIKPGKLVYNDLFTLYSYENQLYEVKMSGKEIRTLLEYSYDGWVGGTDGHVLKMRGMKNPRTGDEMWFFAGSASEMDTAGGLVYDVDVAKPFGERVSVHSFADGSAFDEASEYIVAMNSYRALGGGDMLKKAGVENVEDRIVARRPDIRTLIDEYITKHGSVNSALVGDKAVIGQWKFVPESMAKTAVEKDMGAMFRMF